MHAVFVGTGVGFFEQFYVQSPRGRWLRSMHPVRSIFLYTIVVLILYLISIHVSHVVLWRFEDLAIAYRKLPIAIPFLPIRLAQGGWQVLDMFAWSEYPAPVLGWR
jgi:hypothetical protein